MKNNVTLKQKIDELPDRTVALLGLLKANRSKKSTACPTDATFDAFLQGKLKGQARETMLAHLNQCPNCYQHWIDELQKQPPVSSTTQEKIPKPTIAWWQGLGDILRFPSWQVSTYFATLLIFAVLIHTFSPQLADENPDIAGNDTTQNTSLSKIQQAYAGLIAQSLDMPETDLTHSLEAEAFSISATQAHSSKVVFEQCLSATYAAIQTAKPSLETVPQDENKVYCELAQWVAILHTLSKNSAQFQTAKSWQQQLTVSQDFEQRLSDNRILLKKIKAIQDHIAWVVKNPAKRATSSRITSNLPKTLDNLIQSPF